MLTTSSDQSLYAALELSKNSWLLAIQVPGRDNPSLHPIQWLWRQQPLTRHHLLRQKRKMKTIGMIPVSSCWEVLVIASR